ncbi:uncharacterized protein N7525_003777 [Penicillium rubens]|uniref:uncharacterized protein n=1 Tax=Penicillium rubens TaxID=1108849 RepID=UPI002A59E561|nr:uncharacterized protein N7525_003777 [Penicillium rubens]KAJ5838589.1 hypothetical protein N7525_003777 [Penicillium rubens]
MVTFHHDPIHHGPSIVVMPQDHPPCSPSTMTPSTMDLPSWSCLRTNHRGHLPPWTFHLGHASGPSTMSTVHHGHLPSYCDDLTVAGFGFRTIGRLVSQYSSVNTSITHYQSDRGELRLQDNRQTGQSIHPNPPPRSPPRSTMIHHSQSDRGGLRLQDNRQAGESIHPNPPPRSPPRSTMIHHSQSDRGGLRLQDNRQTGRVNHPPRAIIYSNQPTTTRLNQRPQSTT